MTRAADISNYTSDLTPEALAAWRADGVELVLVQAIDPPAGFPVGKTRDQVQACLAAGLVVDAYVYLWFDNDISDIQHKLQLLDGLPIRRMWLDVEDESAARYDWAACEAKVRDALNACDSFTVTGIDRTGIYTGGWFWRSDQYMANTTTFADRELWDANYADGVADAAAGFVPYGGWTSCAIKQWQGTTTYFGVSGVDMDVLSEQEANKLTQPAGDPCAPVEAQRDGLIGTLGYVGGDLLKPVAKLKLTSQPKAVQALVAGIRGVCDQQGIAHS